MSEIARVEEEANLILTASVIDNQTSGEDVKGVGTILSELKADGKIEDYDTTENADITNIKFDVSSITLGAGDNEELTATFESGSDAGGYYAQIKEKKYPVSKVNDKIEIGKTEITTSGNSKREIESVETSNSAVATAEIIENENDKVKITGVSKGTAEITVKYTEEIKKTIAVTVKGYVTITVEAEKDTSNNDKGTVSITPSSENNKYLEGSTITLTGIPNPTYELTGWYETINNETEGANPVGTDATEQYQVPSDENITTVLLKAKFEAVSEIAKGINPETYGKYVNYNINLGIGNTRVVTDDWIVFYDDGTNIYIIAADYVPVSNTYLKATMTKIGAEPKGDDYPFSIKWVDENAFKTYKNSKSSSTAANGAADIFTNRPTGTAYLEGRGLLGFWKNAMGETGTAKTIATNSYANAKMTACLMDTKAWEGFAGGLPKGVSGTVYAMGGPTVSMWMESWNAIYPDDKLYYNRCGGIKLGYYVKVGGQPSTNDYSISSNTMKLKTGYNNKLYYPNQSVKNNCYGYWLTSPAANNENAPVVVLCNGEVGGGTSVSYYGYSVSSLRCASCGLFTI